jgi:hypothetical protein
VLPPGARDSPRLIGTLIFTFEISLWALER